MLNSPVTSILRKAVRKENEPLNILTFPTHERYETNLAKTGHNFYAFRDKGIKDWNETYAKVPSNYTLLGNHLPIWLDFDLVLSQNKFGQYQLAKDMSRHLHLPLISLEHTLPPPTWPATQLKSASEMRGDFNVFISDYSVNQWGFDIAFTTRVIKHCVDTELFQYTDGERSPHLLSVVNDWINRDWCCGFNLWRDVVQEDLPVKVLGDTKGLSEPASSIDALVAAYQEALIFVNTSTISPVPTALLEAMSCGCCPVTTATCMIPEVIEHGVNGYMSNNPATLRKYCIELLNNPEKARKMGANARKTVEKHFHKDRFVQQWNDLFKEAANVTYIG